MVDILMDFMVDLGICDARRRYERDDAEGQMAIYHQWVLVHFHGHR
jgi:hypothetical protein